MPDLSFEHDINSDLICGIDEAGRGPLAGPVVASAVILPRNQDIIKQLSGLDDSKKLTDKKKDHFFDLIQNSCHVGVGQATPEEIDNINILQGTFLAMRRALNNLPQKPEYALVDGNQDPSLGIPTQTIIKGDSRSLSIAAASVIAKVTRDRIMKNLHSQYPYYGWESNAGYPTKAHLEGIETHGITPHHRLSFSPLKQRQFHCLEKEKRSIAV